LTLDDLGVLHATDKCSTSHGYMNHYEAHFDPFTSRCPVVLEIGIAQSQSLKCWRDFFGHDARIVGVEYDRGNVELARSLGFEVHQGNCGDRKFLQGVVDSVRVLDIVVDDGDHNAEHQIAAFEVLWPALRDGGLYCIEDLHTAFWEWGGKLWPYLHELINCVGNHGHGLGRAELDPEFVFRSDIERTCSAMHFYPGLVVIEKKAKRAQCSP
jgi:hypothetical protein